MNRSFLALILSLAVLATATANAQVPRKIHYQGYLTNSGGTPVGSPATVTFRLYAAESGGAPLWQETHPSVPITQGSFSVLLGSAEPLALPFDQAYFLGIAVGGDPEMAPRKLLASSPYALHADSLAATATIAGSQVTGPIDATTVGGVVPSSFATATALSVLQAQLANLEASISAQLGTVFTRWGRSVCPSGSELAYAGLAVGSHYTNPGGGSQLLCLAPVPDAGPDFNDATHNTNVLFPVAYQTNFTGLASLSAVNGQGVRCATCRATARTTLMYPGSKSCPSGWTLLYSGYLMGAHYTHYRNDTVCVDGSPETSTVPSTGNFLYPTELQCVGGSGQCPPYVAGRELACSVCAK